MNARTLTLGDLSFVLVTAVPQAIAWLPDKRMANHPVGARENAVAKPIYIVNN